MAEFDLRSRELVKDVMTSPVITIKEEELATKAAQLMDQYKVGCIIVNSKGEKPIGIITERDLIIRVLAKKTQPNKFLAKDIMTSPLITVDPSETLSEAARRMSRLDIRRLGVIYKGNLVGIVSSKDILAATPELIEIIMERARIERGTEESSERPPLAGYCERCGRWSDTIEEYEGQFTCEECRTELKSEY